MVRVEVIVTEIKSRRKINPRVMMNYSTAHRIRGFVDHTVAVVHFDLTNAFSVVSVDGVVLRCVVFAS